MKFWPSLKPRGTPLVAKTDAGSVAATLPYIAEYVAAIDRTERFGFEAPPRLLIRKPCVDMRAVLPVLLDFYETHSPGELLGQTLAIHFALIPRLYDNTGIHLNLTIGWMVHQGKPIFPHDEGLIRRFVAGGRKVWIHEGCPFHLWMTSLACEILDVTFAMNLGHPQTREQCAKRIIYQPADEPAGHLVYHPTLVGPNFFLKTGAVL